MLRIDVKRPDGTIGWTAQFDAQAEADQWVSECRAGNVWGDDSSALEVTATDISALVAAEALREESREAMQVGQAVIAQIRSLNKLKALTGPQIQSIFADQSSVLLLFLLQTGSLGLAKDAINAVQNPLYTADDKALLVSIIDQSGLAD